jgi:hypothetical protein
MDQTTSINFFSLGCFAVSAAMSFVFFMRERQKAALYLDLLCKALGSPDESDFLRRVLLELEEGKILLVIKILRERDFFKARVNAINDWRHKLPEREQKEICDILANGKLGKEASNEKFRAYQ